MWVLKVKEILLALNLWLNLKELLLNPLLVINVRRERRRTRRRRRSPRGSPSVSPTSPGLCRAPRTRRNKSRSPWTGWSSGGGAPGRGTRLSRRDGTAHTCPERRLSNVFTPVLSDNWATCSHLSWAVTEQHVHTCSEQWLGNMYTPVLSSDWATCAHLSWAVTEHHVHTCPERWLSNMSSPVTAAESVAGV